MSRIICWFSCGAASAVATYLALKIYPDAIIARIDTGSEHPDNERFMADCERWYGRKITVLKSAKYSSVDDVIDRRNYMSGPHGATCTGELKKAVRYAFQQPDDLHIFGFHTGEQDRAKRLQEAEMIDMETPLIDAMLDHADCRALVQEVGIELPVMYKLGFQHNNCFSGDTKFITSEGIRKLQDAVGESVKVRGAGGGWTDATIHSFGVQPLMKITLKRNNVNREIYATAEHRWILKQYVHSIKIEKTTIELKTGDKLRSVFGRLSAVMRPSAFGIAQGIVFGDGTRGNTLNTSCTLVLCGEKNKELLKYFSLSPQAKIATGIEVRDLPRHWKDAPSLNDCQSFLYGWLSGYFAADGCVNQGEYILNSANIKHLEFAKSVAAILGIGTNDIRTVSRLGLGKQESEIHSLTLIGATLREDFFLIQQHRERFLASRSRDSHPWTVVSVEQTDRVEDVFCAVVPDGNAFVLDGNILTGNCLGCVKSGSPGYWNLTRKHFPDVFARRAIQERRVNYAMCKLGGQPIFLDELPPDAGNYELEPDNGCSILCQIALHEVTK